MSTKNTKQPQDHKKSKGETEEEAQLSFDEIEGSDLLVPFSKVKGSDQLRLLGKLKTLGLDTSEDDNDTVDIDDLDLDAVADFIDYVSERFAVSTREFEKFTTGQGGFERALTLAIAYAGELGNASA